MAPIISDLCEPNGRFYDAHKISTKQVSNVRFKSRVFLYVLKKYLLGWFHILIIPTCIKFQLIS